MARLRAIAARHGWRLIVGVIAMLTLLVGWLGINAANAAEERRDAEQWHVHTLEVLLASERFRAGTFDVLRGERGYLLTGNEDFLRPYYQGRMLAAAQFLRLRELLADNPAQERNLTQIAERQRGFEAVIDQAIAFERAGAHEQALQIVRAGRGRAEFERLQASITVLSDEEMRLLIERRARLDASAVWNERLSTIAGAIIMLLLAIAAAAAWAAIRSQRRAAAVSEELRRLATIDELTGLPNRRHFMGRLEAELARARRARSPLCLATLDVDHFKRVNDRHGHPAGDAVLRQLAQTIGENIRLEDAAARLGGEEFALLLPDTNAAQARLICDRLRVAIAARLIELPGGGAVRVTLSTGVAMLSPGDDLGSLIRRSDEALYAAKADGRNLVRLAA